MSRVAVCTIDHMGTEPYLIGRQVNPDGSPRTSGTVDSTALQLEHAVTMEDAEHEGPYEAVCGAPVHEISGDAWPPDMSGPVRRCPACSRLVDG